MDPEGFVEFRSAQEMREWLSENHSTSKGVWLRLFKKGSGVACVKPKEALEELLCFGWITGRSGPLDDVSWLGRLTPRRPKSIWSQINTRLAERLIEEGRMQPAGMRDVETAREDGRWARAYSPPSTAKLPPDLLEAVERNEKAKAFLKTLDKGNVYAIVFRIENAKSQERRRAKIASIVEMLEDGKAFH